MTSPQPTTQTAFERVRREFAEKHADVVEYLAARDPEPGSFLHSLQAQLDRRGWLSTAQVAAVERSIAFERRSA